ncbi:MAG: flagellar export chaperone FlgN [Chloroflexi bacterium]|nr:flagellar export chaperone FlgN [Chloroflexota bacterium]
MDDVERARACLVTLEGTLVGEFRAYQTLVKLAKEERRVLSLADLDALLSMVARKEALLGEVGRLEAARCVAIEEWARPANGAGRAVAQENDKPPTLADMLPRIDAPTAGRMKRLREGILALVNQLNDLTHGNRALAALALDRLEAVRNFLISLNQPPAYYHPPGARSTVPGQVEAAALALAVERWA